MQIFRTHTGEYVTGERLTKAYSAVADFWAANAHAVRKQDAYAAHVTEERKELNLQNQLARAEEIRAGEVNNFTIWQRVNTELTGECVAFMN